MLPGKPHCRFLAQSGRGCVLSSFLPREQCSGQWLFSWSVGVLRTEGDKRCICHNIKSHQRAGRGRAGTASCGRKGLGLVSNEEDVTVASWAGIGVFGALDIQRMLSGYEVHYPTHRNLTKTLGEGDRDGDNGEEDGGDGDETAAHVH